MEVQKVDVIVGDVTFEDFLKEEFRKRHERNPQYSLRAFARTLGQDASSVCKIFNGKRRVGGNLRKKLADRLKLNGEQLQSLIDITRFDARRGTQEKEYQPLALDMIQTVVDCTHTAVLLLTELIDFKADHSWVAQRLGITPEKSQEVVERLRRVGLLTDQADGSWAAVSTSFTTLGAKLFTNEVLRMGQFQFLQRAIAANGPVPIEKRDQSTICFSCNDEDIPKIKEYIKKFRRRLDSLAGESTKKNAVYAMTVALYPLTQIEKTETEQRKEV